MELFDTSRSVLSPISDPTLDSHRVRLFLKRDDQIDVDVSGNKWRKLKYNVLQCQQLRNKGILTFGGAYSNHLVATAAACKKTGLESVGVVRGDELTENSNETLRRCHELGMHLYFISREEYHLRDERYYHEELLQQFPNLHVVPEGGANYWGMIGCQELLQEIDIPFDRMVTAQGTTTTSCGILLGLKEHQKCSVVPVLKGFDSLGEMRTRMGKSGIDVETIDHLLSKAEVLDTFHFGGYAKYDDSLLKFMQDFYQHHGIKLDHVYTAKAMYAIWEGIKQGSYDGETIVFLHTGGLQGVKGLEYKLQQPVFD